MFAGRPRLRRPAAGATSGTPGTWISTAATTLKTQPNPNLREAALRLFHISQEVRADSHVEPRHMMRPHHIAALLEQLERRLVLPDPHVESPQFEADIVAAPHMRDMIANQSQIDLHIFPADGAGAALQQVLAVLPEEVGVSVAESQQVEDALDRQSRLAAHARHQVVVRHRRERLHRVSEPQRGARQRVFRKAEGEQAALDVNASQKPLGTTREGRSSEPRPAAASPSPPADRSPPPSSHTPPS